MDKLATLLKKSGVVTEAQLHLVMQKQRVLGGPLELYLITEGLLSESVLQAFLAQVYGNPGGQVFNQEPDPEALGLLDRDRAARLRIIPLRQDGEKLRVLAVDPSDTEALHELSKRTGTDRILPSVINQIRFAWLLDRWYGIACSDQVRQAMTMMEAAAQSQESDTDEDVLIYDPMAGAETGALDPQLLAQTAMLTDDGETLTVEEVIPILEEELPLLIVETEENDKLRQQGTETSQKIGHGLPVLEPQDFESTFKAADSLDALFDAFGRFGVKHFTALAAFKIQGAQAKGWRCEGQDADLDAIRSFESELAASTILSVDPSGVPRVTTTMESDQDGRIATAMGCKNGAPIISVGVQIKGRLVLLLCGCMPANRDPNTILGNLTVLASLASAAVVRMILNKKKARKPATKPSTKKPEPAKKTPAKKTKPSVKKKEPGKKKETAKKKATARKKKPVEPKSDPSNP
ncbi:MAG: hypothetical protein J7M25_06305 [Deltaproteobacteria bacterium]|nr:hypothetical protein [Deltaproteobacteria bacterium]